MVVRTYLCHSKPSLFLRLPNMAVLLQAMRYQWAAHGRCRLTDAWGTPRCGRIVARMGRQEPPPINTTSAPAVLPVTVQLVLPPLNAEAFSSVARRRQDLWLSRAWIVQDTRLGRTLRLGK